MPTGYARSMIPEGDANRAEPLLQYPCDLTEVVNLTQESRTNTKARFSRPRNALYYAALKLPNGRASEQQRPTGSNQPTNFLDNRLNHIFSVLLKCIKESKTSGRDNCLMFSEKAIQTK